MTDRRIERVVVVDDEPFLRDIATELLREAGMEVVAVATPGAALDAIFAHDPDVLLTDQCMPGMTGVELARAVRSARAERGCPYIVLWTAARAWLPPAAERLVDAVLDKPWKGPQLVERVRRGGRLYRHRRWSSAAPAAVSKRPI